MSGDIIQLQYPTMGVDRRLALRNLPPFAAADAQNVRPYDVTTRRARGGPRPGTLAASNSAINGSNAIQGVWSVAYSDSSKFDDLPDDFDGTSVSSQWSQASHASGTPSVANGLCYSEAAGTYGVVRSALSDFDTSSAYKVGMWLAPYKGAFDAKYQIYLRGDNSSPAFTTNGLVVELILAGSGVYSGTAKVYASGTPTSYALTGGTLTGGTDRACDFAVKVTGNDIVVTFAGNTLLSQSAIGSPAGARFGFGFSAVASGQRAQIDRFLVQYSHTAAFTRIRDLVVVLCGGTLYRETFFNEFTSVSGVTVSSDKTLNAVQHQGKLYIADWEAIVRTSDTGAVGSGATKFDDSAVSDWTTVGITAGTHVLALTHEWNNAGHYYNNSGVYTISSVASGEITLGSAIPQTTAGGTYSYEIGIGAKVFDPVANTLTNLDTNQTDYYDDENDPDAFGRGAPPLGCSLIESHLDRIYLGHKSGSPNAWFCSRQGDVNDWGYDANEADPQRAIAGTSSAAGLPPRPITALIRGGEDLLLFGMADGIRALRGDPGLNGQMYQISDSVGPISARAYARGPNNEIIMLTRDGVYVMPSGGVPQPKSREHIPDELLGVNVALYDPVVAYDPTFRWVNIFLTHTTGGEARLDWCLDWDTGGWWPDLFTNTHRVAAVALHAPQGSCGSSLLLGCRDGKLRRFYRHANNDDGTAFTNYIVYGPIACSQGAHFDGVVNAITGELSAASGSVTVTLQVASGADSLLTSSAITVGTWSTSSGSRGGVQYTNRPRRRGTVFALKLTGGTYQWSVETISVERLRAGKLRLIG